MSDNWRSEPATEPQIEKLRFFGCTWDDGITAGQASDALEECARQFPQVETAYKLHPATEGLLEELRLLGQLPHRSLTCGEATWLIESIKSRNQQWHEPSATTFRKETNANITEPQSADDALTAEKYDWRTAPASEKQKEKLRLLGCTFDANITVGIAKLLIEHHKSAPETSQPSVKREGFFSGESQPLSAEAPSLPAPPAVSDQMPEQKSTPSNSSNFFEARKRVQAIEIQEAARPQATDEQLPPKIGQYLPAAATPAFIPPTPQQLDEIRAFGQVVPAGLTFQEAKTWIERCKFLYPDKLRKPAEEVTIQEAAKPQKTNPIYIIPGREVRGYADQQAQDAFRVVPSKLEPQINGLTSHDKYVRKNCAVALGRSKDPHAVKPLISCLADSDWGVRMQAAQSLADLGFPEAVEALIETLKDPELYIRKAAADALGQLKDVRAVDALVSVALQDSKEFVRQAAAAALARIKGKTPTNTTAGQFSHDRYAALEPVKLEVSAFAGQKVEPLLKACASSDNCYWLPLARAAILVQVSGEAKFTIGQSRQIAHKIQWAGYCVEPDARFGGGTYDWHQTIGVFKSCASDSTEPSPAYLGAANLLRLCVLIAAADGQIDEVELDVFRQVIENQLELTQTDHRRLQVLEKLLVQDPSSAAKTLAKVAKSIPAHKRLLIGRVLVRVAAADSVITKDERRALERIFKVFEISQEVLENLMFQACPSSQAGSSQKTTPVSIPINPNAPNVSEAELVQKEQWDEWMALQERISARHKTFSPEPTIQNAGTSASAEQFAKPVAKPPPPGFTLDMDRVYAITNETKEVIGILSVLMEDEPKASIALPEIATAPAAEIHRNSSVGQSDPQPERFNGLAAAFQPIIERLLARDSWSLADFNALAREFQLMPLKIRDTLNEWSDDSLGDFILDGEDPVLVRRELITKENI